MTGGMKRCICTVGILMLAIVAHGQEMEDVRGTWGVFPMVNVILNPHRHIKSLDDLFNAVYQGPWDRPIYIVDFNGDGTAHEYHLLPSGVWKVETILWFEVENEYTTEISITDRYEDEFLMKTWYIDWCNDNELLVTEMYQYADRGNIVVNIRILRPWSKPEIEKDN